VPTKAPKGTDKVYYDIKDISYLAHEPLLHKFREFKSFMKKVRRAAGRKELDEARRIHEMRPKFVLNHLIKERYPRFIDALRDMNDALSMVHLFAALPSDGRVTAEHTTKCNELVRHWQYYVAKSQCLQKAFISIKGVYFQVEILGEPITWLAPHQFTQFIPREVDFRVMVCFLEFYEVFIKFVLFKLYHQMDLQYPPVMDKTLNDAGCFLLAVKAMTSGSDEKGAQVVELQKGGAAVKNADKQGFVAEHSDKKRQQLISSSASRLSTLEGTLKSLEARAEEVEQEDGEGSDVEEDEPITKPLEEAFGMGEADNDEKNVFSKGVTYDSLGLQINTSVDVKASLFQGLKFFVNREVPLDWLQLLILNCGGTVGWEGLQSPFPASDNTITHHIIDRPLNAEQEQMHKKHVREFVQPQWVFDCLNTGTLLPVAKYVAGSPLPPHLSPFVDDDKEGYVPQYREELKALTSGSSATKDASKANDAGMDVDEDEEDAEDYEKSIRAEKAGKKVNSSSAPKKNAALSKDAESASEGEDEVEGESEEGSDEDDEDEAEQSRRVAPTASSKGHKGVVYEPKKDSKFKPGSAAAEVNILLLALHLSIGACEPTQKGISITIIASAPRRKVWIT
jgi:pescadillo protein